MIDSYCKQVLLLQLFLSLYALQWDFMNLKHECLCLDFFI